MKKKKNTIVVQALKSSSEEDVSVSRTSSGIGKYILIFDWLIVTILSSDWLIYRNNVHEKQDLC